MSLLGTIRNSLPVSRNTLNNAVPTAQTRSGVGGYGTTMTTGHSLKKMKNLTNLQLVQPTISNARRAVEMDSTTWSSLMSLVIKATKNKIEIVNDKDANPKAVDHIKQKVREWNLDSLRVTTGWKNLVDGRGFIETYIKPGVPSIQEVNHLAFDELDYNFIDITDPYTNTLLGYKQKATIYPVPDNWETLSFDTLNNRPGIIKEKTFTNTLGYIPVFMPKFFIGDGNSEGLVFKVLDDVYCLKTLKNIMPAAAKMAATTVGVKVGNKDFPFKPYSPNDPIATQISKSEERMNVVGKAFAKKYLKDVILFDGSVDVSMIGDGKLPDFPSFNNFYKQEIRETLLTPDSLFNAQSSSYAASKEQLGSGGQEPIISYIENNINLSYEKYIIDLELSLAGYSDSIGKIHIGISEKETENEVDLNTIAQGILSIRPDLFDIVVNEYYPRLASKYDPKKNVVPETIPTNTTINNSLSGAYKDGSNHLTVVQAAKQLLEENGVLI